MISILAALICTSVSLAQVPGRPPGRMKGSVAIDPFLSNELRPTIERAIEALSGQALHAYSLAFTHPRSYERLAFTVDLPPPFQALLYVLDDT